jgi:preprotein translocase subunit SecG
MLYGLLLFIHVAVSILLVVVILMQSSKGGGLAGIAGGAASQAVIGGRQAATLLHKVTIILALVFGVNLLFLGILSKGRSTPKSVTQEQMQQVEPTPLDFLGDEPAAAPGGEAAGAGETAPAPTTDGSGDAQGE